MKHLKYFENINKEYEIGDFVVCNIDYITDESTQKEYNDYLNNTAGKIIDKEINNYENDIYTIFYIDIPESIYEKEDENNILTFDINQIIRHASEIEIETFKLKEKSNKFNL